MKTKSILCFVFAFIVSLSGCRKIEVDPSSTFHIGDSDKMLMEILDVVQKGFNENARDYGWSGGVGESFACKTSIFVNKATLKEVSSRLEAELNALETKYGADIEGSTRSSASTGGYDHFSEQYSKDGILYFTDLLLREFEASEHGEGGVRLQILHKGVVM